MRKGALQGLYNAKLQEAGNNKARAGELMGIEVENLIKEKKLKPEDFSFKAIFEELVDPAGSLSMQDDAVRVAEAIGASAFPTFTTKIINSKIIDSYELLIGDYKPLYTEADATMTGPEPVAGFTAMGGLKQRQQYMAYEEDSFEEKYWTIYKDDFGRIISITREMIFDDRTGDILRKAATIGEKAGQQQAQMIIQTLEVAARTLRGESSTMAAIYKGSTLSQATFYSTDHSATIDSAGTNCNLITDALGATGLSNAMYYLSRMVDEEGDPIVVTPRVLVVSYKKRQTAWELLTGSVKADTYGNLENWFKTQNIVTAVTPFLSDVNDWYLGDPAKQILWLWVWRPATATMGADSELAFTNQIVQRYRFNFFGGCGHTDYRFIVRANASS